jgi:hypothetical protein
MILRFNNRVLTKMTNPSSSPKTVAVVKVRPQVRKCVNVYLARFFAIESKPLLCPCHAISIIHTVNRE